MSADSVASSLRLAELQQQIDKLSSKLRESEARHALVTDAVAEGIYEWNIESSALWVSERLIQIFGFEGRELKAGDWNGLVHPEDFAGYRNALRDCLKGACRRLDCEYRVKHADGVYRWVEDRAVPVFDKARRAIRLIGAVSDVTARKESERGLREALEQQTAISKVLEAIERSTSDIQPVLDTMLSAALRLCRAQSGGIAVRQGDVFRYVATLGWAPEADKTFRSMEITPGRGTVAARVLAEAGVVQVEDVASDLEFERRDMAELAQWHTALGVPLMREGRPIGAIALTRDRIEPFSERQIGLVRTFADQAVIAMENARLLRELHERTDDLQEALEYQTAIGEVLTTISRSTFDLGPVLQTLSETALRLCEAEMVFIVRREGEQFIVVTAAGATPESASDARDYQLYQKERPITVDRGSLTGRVALEKSPVQITDITADPEYKLAGASALGKIRTQLGVPLIREGTLAGVMVLSRQRVEPFSERQINLLSTFADQAVIAMENARLLGELRESLDQQTATSDVLKTISRSSVGLETVLQTLVETVGRLCRADQSYLYRQEDGLHRLLASHGLSDDARRYFQDHPFEPTEHTLGGRVILRRQVVHIADVLKVEDYGYGEGQQLAGYRTMLGIPLLAQDKMVGVFIVTRTRVDPFTDKETALANGFADQAVIAIENARLFEELRERQNELRTTFDNIGDAVVMFDDQLRLGAWNRNFQKLLDVSDAFLAERPSYDDYVRMLVERGEFGSANREAETRRLLRDIGRPWSRERTRPDGRVIEVRNNPVPGGGTVMIYSDITERKKAEAEIRAARDAAEAALERQTATADILKVIAGSPTDVQPVLDALVKSAVRFCGATDATISLRDGDDIVRKAHEGPLGARIGARRPLDGDSASAAAIRHGRTIHYEDINALDPVEFAGAHRRAMQDGYRAALAAPMLRDGIAIGNIALRKVEAGAFTSEQIALLETFAAQAVIAIENVRLFNDLREALEQQTATADILRVISQSPTDVKPVLAAVAKAALKFCGARDAQVALRSGDTWSVVAHEGPIGALSGTRRLSRQTAPGRAMVDGEVVQIVDLQSAEGDEFQEARELGTRLGFRAALAAPLLREEVPIGAISLRRPEPGAFTASQVELLKSFAAQAVIAIENVRLFTELRDSLERLKAAQANLVQSEKMASLGQLTAGIAHEIKNPLNFVNNFAGLSVELLDELKEAAASAFETLDEYKRAEIDETMQLLVGNLQKVIEHGKRADGIVKSMLSHSRGGTGDWAPSDINVLVEEALNLAYHGARAHDKEFNVTLERDFEKAGKPIDVVPQDVTRVFLNLFGNAFYAANKRRVVAREAGYRPLLRVTTRDLGEMVEVKVRDNGTGIPDDVRAKLFQPFFTTKPTGEGTGLGLSISYDIVTQQHGGTIEVESEVGRYTEFTVRLPRSRRGVSAERAR